MNKKIISFGATVEYKCDIKTKNHHDFKTTFGIILLGKYFIPYRFTRKHTKYELLAIVKNKSYK